MLLFQPGHGQSDHKIHRMLFILSSEAVVVHLCKTFLVKILTSCEFYVFYKFIPVTSCHFNKHNNHIGQHFMKHIFVTRTYTYSSTSVCEIQKRNAKDGKTLNSFMTKMVSISNQFYFF